MSLGADELALLCALTSRPDPAPRVRDLPPAHEGLRGRVAQSIAHLAIHQLRELGPTRPPRRGEVVRLMGSRNQDVRLLAMQLVGEVPARS
jgi:hypothetical protein